MHHWVCVSMYAITIYFNSLNSIIIINLNQLKFYIKKALI